jgi:hypothetical protein
MGQDLVADVSLDRSSHSKKTAGKLGIFAAREIQPAKNNKRRRNNLDSTEQGGFH